VLEGLQESLVAYEEGAKRSNLDGAWCSSSLLMCRVNSHTFVEVQGVCLCWCVWSDSTTIVNNVMDKLSPNLMDKLTFCNNYLYSYGQVIFVFVDKLSLLWCLFCLKRYVCWNGSNERSSWHVNEDRLKGDKDSQTSVSFLHKGDYRAYTSGTHARKEEDGLLLEFPCNSTRTRSV
jgi:hypothetical protein